MYRREETCRLSHMVDTSDFQPYLQAILKDSADSNHQDWQSFYTPTQAELPLQVQTWLPSQSSSQSFKEQREQMEVLDGLRKYAPSHVLLLGKPGSGKSTSLKRLQWEEARRCLEGEKQENDGAIRIPVLLELRSFRHNLVLKFIQDSFKRRKLRLGEEEIDHLLFNGQLLLLFDGLNELPSDNSWQEIGEFRRDYPDSSMIFSSRDLGAGADLGIENKLEMTPLTEPQMRQFIEKRLPGQTDILLQQIRDRLRELAETPLLLKMFCDVFEYDQQIPKNRGELFRKFADNIDQIKHRGVLTASSGFLGFRDELLQQLAVAMLQGGNKPTEFLLQIDQDKAEQLLEQSLTGRVKAPAERAKGWLEDLLEHHLLQLAARSKQIEFHHQLFQDYYAAEWLLLQLPTLSDEQLKCYFLNYLKWTEPLALMLALVEHDSQAMRVVNLALEVDLLLGARLAGEVEQEFQEQTISLITEKDIPHQVKIYILSLTRSESVISRLDQALEHEMFEVRLRAVKGLEKFNNEAVVPVLLKALKDKDSQIRLHAVAILNKIGSQAAIPELTQALKDENFEVRWNAARALANMGNDTATPELLQAIPVLLEALKDEEFMVRIFANCALTLIGGEEVVTALRQALKDKKFDQSDIVDILGSIGNELAILALCEALESENHHVVFTTVYNLGHIGESAIPALNQVLKHQDPRVRENATQALGMIGTETAIDMMLRQILTDENCDVCEAAISALTGIGNEAAISALCQAFEHKNLHVRTHAAEALAIIGDDANTTLFRVYTDPHLRRIAISILAIPALFKAWRTDPDSVFSGVVDIALKHFPSEVKFSALLQALTDQETKIRMYAATMLGKAGSDDAIPRLLQALEDKDFIVAWLAASALEEIGSEAAKLGLLQSLNHESFNIRTIAATGLNESNNKVAAAILLQALEHEESDIRCIAAIALGRIGNRAAIPTLFQALEHEDYIVRLNTVKALGKIGKAAIPALLQALEYEESHSLRFEAAAKLNAIDKDIATFALVKALEHENFEIRVWAAIALGLLIKDETAIPTLVQALKHEDYITREMAVGALGEIGSETAISALLTALHYENTCRLVVPILGKIGNEEAISALHQVLDHEDSAIRMLAITVLGDIDDEKVISILSQALNHKEADTRARAITVLGKIGSKTAVSALAQALTHEDYEVRHCAINELQKISVNEVTVNALLSVLARDLKHENLDARREAITSLVQIGNEAAIDVLFQALDDKNAGIREAVVKGLEEIGSDLAVSKLFQAMKSQHSDVRSNAAIALGHIGNEAVISVLSRALKSEDFNVRSSAAIGLGENGNKIALPVLLQALDHEDYIVREDAAAALGELADPEILPDLSERLLAPEPSNAIDVITKIQGRCKFYNYGIAESSPRSLSLLSGLPNPMNSSTELALRELEKMLANLQQKYPNVTTETATKVINVAFTEMRNSQPQQWQNFMNLKQQWNGVRTALVKVGEHYADTNPLVKAVIGYFEGVSENLG